MQSRGFKVSRSNTKYLKVKTWFQWRDEEGGGVTIGDVAIPRANKFIYLGTIVQDRGDIDKDINHHIKVGWQK